MISRSQGKFPRSLQRFRSAPRRQQHPTSQTFFRIFPIFLEESHFEEHLIGIYSIVYIICLYMYPIFGFFTLRRKTGAFNGGKVMSDMVISWILMRIPWDRIGYLSNNMGVSENSVPLNPMVNDQTIPIKWL